MLTMFFGSVIGPPSSNVSGINSVNRCLGLDTFLK